MTVTHEALRKAAGHYRRRGISVDQALILGYAELTGDPLDPWAFDDAAVLLRAETLVLEGLSVVDAFATARQESATWS